MKPSRQQAKIFFTAILTRKQLLRTYRFCGMTSKQLPHKKAVTRLAIPAEQVTISITRCAGKNPCGKPLYRCEHQLAKAA